VKTLSHSTSKLDWETIYEYECVITYTGPWNPTDRILSENSNPFVYPHDVRPKIKIREIRGRHNLVLVRWLYRYYDPTEKVLCSKRNISTVLCTNTHSFELLVFNLCTAFIYPIKVRVYSPRFSVKKTQTRHLYYRVQFIFCTLYAIRSDPFDEGRILIISENTDVSENGSFKSVRNFFFFNFFLFWMTKYIFKFISRYEHYLFIVVC